MAKKITFTLKYDESLENYLQHNYSDLAEYRILSKSLDARGANRGKKPSYQYVLEYCGTNEKLEERTFELPSLEKLNVRPLIIGAGPAGLFCALRLIDCGLKPIVIERGKSAQLRMRDIARFWRYGELNPETNVCFGEGGAGLFSDGKLITRVKSPHISYVMKKLCEFGAPKEVEYLSNPHLGSNKIRGIISNLSAFLISKGCHIYYETCVENLIVKANKVMGVETRCGKTFESEYVIMATGHSAKNIYQNLEDHEVAMQAKDFAIGLRIEHPRVYMNRFQFGDYAEDENLGTARYRLSYHNKKTDRGTYSFCMCPGGYVLSSGTHAQGIVVNGMSNSTRHSPWSNSALVVSVKKDRDFTQKGLQFQESIEQKAYEVSKARASGREIPSQRLEDFLKGKIASKKLPTSSCPSGNISCDLTQILPNVVVEHLRFAIDEFNKNIVGFNYKDALLMAPETRTSSPLKVLRDKELLQSTSHQGLYPCGEGAGHAGGITSAAVDGVNVAQAIARHIMCKS